MLLDQPLLPDHPGLRRVAAEVVATGAVAAAVDEDDNLRNL